MTALNREHDIRPKPLLDEFFALLKADADDLAASRGTFVEVACGGCAATTGQIAFEKEGFPYRLCGDCGSLYVSPRPTAAALAAYVASSRAVRFWSTHFYGETAVARRAQIYKPRALAVAEHLTTRSLSAARVADIGAGYGLFLDELRRIRPDIDPVAVEPEPRLAATCEEQGFMTVRRWAEAAEDGELNAHFATAFEVLEHVFDPVAFVRGCLRMLRPGGALLVTTLTIDGFDLQVLWERSRSISPPQHLNFLSREGLRRAAERAGARVVSLTTPGRLDVDIVRNVVLDDPHVAIPRFARRITDSDESTRSAFQQFLQQYALSSHAHLLLERPE